MVSVYLIWASAISSSHACQWKLEHGLQEVFFFLSLGRFHGFNSSSQILWQASSLTCSAFLLVQLTLFLEECWLLIKVKHLKKWLILCYSLDITSAKSSMAVVSTCNLSTGGLQQVYGQSRVLELPFLKNPKQQK